MRITLAELAEVIDAELVGDGAMMVTGLAEPAAAMATDLALATNATYAEKLSEGAARAALLWAGADVKALGLAGALIPKRPRFAMAALTRQADPGQGFTSGISAHAAIDPSAEIGADVSIGAFTVVMPGARIGTGSVIGPHCFVGAGASIGPDAYLRDHVSIGAGVQIGERFVAQPGARIGSDGFSFVTEAASNAEVARGSLGAETQASAQEWHRIHSLGAVIIDDDVEVGANSCIDSGTIRPTRVGQGTKIDNLVHIGHNCVVGRHCLLCGQVGLAGSVTVGDAVVLGGQVGVSDNVSIGSGVVAGGASAIFTSVPAGRAILGNPATKMDSQIEIYKALRRLPRTLRDLAAAKKAVSKSADSD